MKIAGPGSDGFYQQGILALHRQGTAPVKALRPMLGAPI